MILNAYSVYDRKTMVYCSPFFAVSDGAAVRTFTDLVNDGNSLVHRYPDDYVLFRLGAYDDSTGQLLPATAAHVADANICRQPNAPGPAHGANGQVAEA